MGNRFWPLCALLLALNLPVYAQRVPMPYREAGLDKREAALHLLSRFSFGVTPGQVEEVARQGPQVWFEEQLKAVATPEAPLASNNVAAIRERKLKRALHSRSQLLEVMTDFWFNHFNVSYEKAQRGDVADYEDTIRAHAMGQFHALLTATAKHPAMLIYLDNEQSRVRAGQSVPTTEGRVDPFGYGGTSSSAQEEKGPMGYGPAPRSRRDEQEMARPVAGIGINENYARELMELHTLGVDGGYTQDDVIEVARVLSGWGVESQEGKSRFRFYENFHDDGEKTILHRKFRAGRGLKEGEEVLEMLSGNIATAEHISRKLAIRFVSDHPSDELVRKLRRRFISTRGDSSALLREIVGSEEFWKSRGAKVKTPFEYCASALRLTEAEIKTPWSVLSEIEGMGQSLYSYPPPTGFPDRADFWISPGNLARRMNFGLLLMTGQINGVKVQAPEYLKPPRDALDALTQQSQGLLEKEDLRKLVPIVKTTDLEEKAREKAQGKKSARKLELYDTRRVMGVVIGSPQFQSR